MWSLLHRTLAPSAKSSSHKPHRIPGFDKIESMITAGYLARACFGSLNGLNGARSELDIRGLLCNLSSALSRLRLL